MNLIYSKYSDVHLLNTFVDFIVDELESVEPEVLANIQCLSFSKMILVLGNTDCKTILNLGDVSQKFFDRFGSEFNLKQPLNVVDHINYGKDSVENIYYFYVGVSDRGYCGQNKNDSLVEHELNNNRINNYSFYTIGNATFYDADSYILSSNPKIKLTPNFKSSTGYHGLSINAGRICTYYLNKICLELIRYNINDIIELQYNTTTNNLVICNSNDLVYEGSYVMNIIEDYFDFNLSEFQKTFDKEKGHSELTFQMTQDMNNQKYIKDLILV